MSDSAVPAWLKSLPLAPIYHPSETEFADPIAFISRIEREAAAFGICKVVPPLPKPSRKFVLANLNSSLSKSPDLGPVAAPPTHSSSAAAAVFTTRHQELGASHQSSRPHMQVWQSGEVYTLDQFEAKAKSFYRSQLSSYKDVNPLLIESLFWRAASDKPIYIEYANDVPGSGFAPPEAPLRKVYFSHRRKRKRSVEPTKLPAELEGTAGWKISNSPWNLQVIARSPDSLTRFMPDDIPGVTSPMVYIGMLFSWFAWHVEDHELHSLNFLHMGAPKTWYAVPCEYAAALEEVVRVEGYGESVDRLAALGMLGEKTNILSPEVLVASGIPCYRLVQHPGEFVVTFPRAYHIGFSHGFNCGEAANFATPRWLNVAKEAAIRRAAMDHLPMLSHQQLLYMLTMSFIFRVPRELLVCVRSSRLRDRMKDERELLIKKEFLTDLMSENRLLCILLEKEATAGVVLWDPEFLPNQSHTPQSCSISLNLKEHGSSEVGDKQEILDQRQGDKPGNHSVENNHKASYPFCEPVSDSIHCLSTEGSGCQQVDMKSDWEPLEGLYTGEDDLPFGLNIDSGSLACVACGILGYPFMVIVQPSPAAVKELLQANCEASCNKQPTLGSPQLGLPLCHAKTLKRFDSDSTCKLPGESNDEVHGAKVDSASCGSEALNTIQPADGKAEPVPSHQINSSKLNNACISLISAVTRTCLPMNSLEDHDNVVKMGLRVSRESIPVNSSKTSNQELGSTDNMKPLEEADNLLSSTSVKNTCKGNKWDISNSFTRPRVFCLEHALEIEKMLHSKGGTHMLVICYSEYLKIKAQAMAVAEEIGFQFKFQDIEIVNASAEDLGLINISIDDEGCEEHGEDWTSKLGVNLKYFVKLKKELSNERHPSLSLHGIFSNLNHISFASNMNWQSKKSRTLKVFPSSESDSCIDSAKEKHGSVAGNTSAASTDILVYERRTVRKLPGFIGMDMLTMLETGNKRTGNRNRCDTVSRLEHSLKDKVARVGIQADVTTKGLIMDSPIDFQPPGQQNTQIRSVASHEIQVEPSPEESTLMDVEVNYLNLEVFHDDCGSEVQDKPKFSSQCKVEGLYDVDIYFESKSKICNRTFNSAWNQQDAHCKMGKKLEYDVQKIEGGRSSSQAIHEITEAPEHDSVVVRLADSIKAAECSGVDNMVRQANGNAIVDQASATKQRYELPRPIIVYTRRAGKNKKGKQENDLSSRCLEHTFIRSPCEGLRPRFGRTSVENHHIVRVQKKRTTSSSGEGRDIDTYKCNIEGCTLNFRNHGELQLHKQNFCIFKGCKKRFSSHSYLVSHHNVHEGKRAHKCPYKGCAMSFKWAWAKTEHMRLHTGERPYKCEKPGCGKVFRFLSDFSHHRRKMNHW